MESTLRLSLRPGISLHEQADQLTLEAPLVSPPSTSATFKKLSPTLMSVVKQLLDGPSSEQDLAAQVLTADGFPGLAKFNIIVSQMAGRAMLCHTVWADDAPLFTIVPIAIFYRFEPDKLKPDGRYVLSRFTLCRRDNGTMILESPLGYASVRLHSQQAMNILSMLAEPRKAHDMAEVLGSDSLPNHVLTVLLNAQMLTEVMDDGTTAEDHDRALAQWEIHDLYFHSRSRMGRHNNPFGKAYAFEGEIEPQPAIKPAMSDEIIRLYKPDLEALKESDVPFTQVLENRRSIRSYGDKPISDQQLGEFLYRAARVQICYDDRRGGVTFRPYPGGGALHALEIYPVIDRCENIASGLYHYNPLDHHLCKVSERNWHVESLLEMGWQMIAELDHPQVLLVIAARFQRVQWKYASIAYATILKDLGGLYQTMYLVGEAMGLAPCALGGGHSDLFARAAKLNYFAETCVGGFVLGTRGPQAPWIMDQFG
ncbi:MAG: SagB/ThcOx family dehydrogenase [Chloroflexi bacterium]|nr:MAG: SagB/ThcOx family dehydrogenase [Chloroflexota bacterium]